MKKTNLKKYNKGLLSKDYHIGFFAGLSGGFTVLIFTMMIPFLLNKEYFKFGIGFIIYVVIGVLIFLVGEAILLKTFGNQNS